MSTTFAGIPVLIADGVEALEAPRAATFGPAACHLLGAASVLR